MVVAYSMAEFDQLTPKQCWEAVQRRDASLDGAFIFAVTTTGIYCRPSCPARTPKRENVEYFASVLAARDAGYRACKRCLPDQRSPQLELVERVCDRLQQPDGASLTLDALASQLFVSPSQLHRTFKRLMGITPRQYAAAVRTQRFADNLKQGQGVVDAALDAGYASSGRVYENEPLGMTPKTYRQGGAGLQIRYSISDSVLGFLLVAQTERGICAVSLGDAETELVTALHLEFPKAHLLWDDDTLATNMQQLLLHLEGKQPHLDLPLDLQVTAFQQMVLESLRQIPYGETRTYTEIANMLNKPKAARAVARACATNPAAIVAPCHRVVRKDGGLAGYRWGLERKRQLLETERNNS